MSRDPGDSPDEDDPSTPREPDRDDAADPAATAPSDDLEETDDTSPVPDGPDVPADQADSPDDQAEEPDAAADPDDEGDEPTEETDESQEDGSGEPDTTVDKSDAVKDGAETETDEEEDADSDEEADANGSDTEETASESDTEDSSADDIEADSEDGSADDIEADSEDGSADEPEGDAEDGSADEPEGDAEDGSADEPEGEKKEKEAGEEEEGEEEEGDEEEGDEEEGESTDTPDEAKTPIERKTGPSEDEEQPLTEHIEEMVKRVAVVLFIAGIISLIAFPFGEEFINFLWYSILPSDISKPHVYHPLELIITQLKAASLLGVVLALPIFVYQTYAFMRPGLYPHERRYYLAAVPTSLVLAFVGLLFGYFLVLPAVMTYFMQYSRDVVDIAFALGETFTLMLILLAFLAIVFQIPLFIMLAIMMGLTTRTWLAERRLIMWGVFLGIAFLFSPDPTGMAPFLIALTMVGLFEGTLALLKWTGRGDR